MENKKNVLHDLINKAKKLGADAVEAVYVHGDSIAATVQNQNIESFERANGHDLGLRVIINKRQAIASTTDFSPQSLKTLVENAVAMARHVPQDKYCGLADPDQLVKSIPNVDSYDAALPKEEALISEAKAAEAAALAVQGVTSSEGASASWGASQSLLLSSNGFEGESKSSSWSISVAAVAGKLPDMQVDYDYSSTVYKADLESAKHVGMEAGARAVRRLNPKQVGTGKVPVIFDPRVGTEILGCFANAINGISIARGMSFLKDAMETQVFGPTIRVVDDPLMPRGLRSRGYDGEGLPTVKRHIIEDGQLTSWILDLSSARQLGLQSTGNASRGPSSVPRPSVSNFYLQPGKQSPESLIKSMNKAFYVTELMGNGINAITGDFSQGASGLWIENGEITHAVSEVTIAGNLKDMFKALIPCNDLKFKYGINVPTVLIEGMTVAGS